MTAYEPPDPDLVRMVAALFADKVAHDVVLTAESEGMSPELWRQVAELDLPWVGIEESVGGAGGSLADALSVARMVGKFAVPLPIVETYLAAWLLMNAGQAIPRNAPMSVAPGSAADTLTLVDGALFGTIQDVPWGREAEVVVAVVEVEGVPHVVSLDPRHARVTHGHDLSGQPRDRLDVDGLVVEAHVSGVSADRLFLQGALVRAAQMAGAMDGVFELTKKYTAERVQFGRPINQFQSVQAHLVTLAQMSVLTSLCVDSAARASIEREAAFDICAAKFEADRNATRVIRAGHQAHGAIGMTQEYALQDFTKRLNAWKGEFGDEAQLAHRVGDAVVGVPALAFVATDGGWLTV